MSDILPIGFLLLFLVFVFMILLLFFMSFFLLGPPAPRSGSPS